MILIVDFGSQTTHLISRRIRELGVDSEIIDPENALSVLHEKHPSGIILSGGPASVYEQGAPTVDATVFEESIPVLGICYGQQLMAHILKGTVKPGTKKEFGPAAIQVTDHEGLFRTLPPKFVVWMNHGDEVISAPTGALATATTATIPFAAFEDHTQKRYGVQFHPEVIHTQFGDTILSNFLEICGETIKSHVIDDQFVRDIVADVKDSIGDRKAICALSGGVDSSVAALLVHQAIGDNLVAIYIDSGLMRQDETKTLSETFKTHYKMQIRVIDARATFLEALAGITDPEQKRKAIGKTFIRVFEAEAKKTGAEFLVQGTIYPDVIESSGTKHSKNIKSHHNVGGLPEDMDFVIIEPLRTFYKDEVRKIGEILSLPKEITHRQPFPGPGLAIRIIGEVTEEKLDILRRADSIVREEIENAGMTHSIWQAFAVFTGIKTTGVRGDNRAYGDTIAIRAIEAKDAMSAHWARLPFDLIDKMSTRIVNEIHEVNRVVYDVTNKPPATMEWE